MSRQSPFSKVLTTPSYKARTHLWGWVVRARWQLTREEMRELDLNALRPSWEKRKRLLSRSKTSSSKRSRTSKVTNNKLCPDQAPHLKKLPRSVANVTSFWLRTVTWSSRSKTWTLKSNKCLSKISQLLLQAPQTALAATWSSSKPRSSNLRFWWPAWRRSEPTWRPEPLWQRPRTRLSKSTWRSRLRLTKAKLPRWSNCFSKEELMSPNFDEFVAHKPFWVWFRIVYQMLSESINIWICKFQTL